jgi:hypothetical protein
MVPAGSGYQAAGLSKAFFSNEVKDTLLVSGVIHGKVVATPEPLHGDYDTVMGKIATLEPARALARTYPTGENMQQAWLRTLYLDIISTRYSEEGLISLEQCRESILGSTQSMPDVHQMSYWVMRTCRDNRFFYTEHGYFGFGPLHMQPEDTIGVLLGLYMPVVLRPMESGTYQVAGCCYVHGLMDSEALLGPLSQEWIVQQVRVAGRYRPKYLNAKTEETFSDDPRLGPLPEGWQRIDVVPTADDPLHIDYFHNTITGERMNSDPRLLPAALEQRGVRLQTLRLV